MTDRVHVIWNRAASSSERSAAARDLLDSAADVAVHETSTAADALGVVRQAAENGAELVIAAGGDGTVNLVAQALAGGFDGVSLGVLPIGTGNDLARTLAMPLVPWESARYLLDAAEQRFRKIDLAEVRTAENTRCFVNMATGGNTGQGLAAIDDETKRLWGPLCYLRCALEVVSKLEVFTIQFQCDDAPAESIDALNIFVANGRTSGGGLPAAPEASVEDGLLDVVIVRDGTPVDLAALTAQFVLADYLESDLIVFRRATRIRVDCETSLSFTADGEAIGSAPARFKVRPQALNVVVGPTYAADADRDN